MNLYRYILLSYYYLFISFLLPYYRLGYRQVTDRLPIGKTKVTPSSDFRFVNGLLSHSHKNQSTL